MAPPKKNTEALTVRLHEDLLSEIDNARRQDSDIPTRPELIRRILDSWSKGQVYVPGSTN